MTTITKDQIRDKVGKKWWLDNQQILAAKLDYVSGIETFDEILDGKTLKEIDAVIHLEKYPKGLLFKIAKGLGFKTYPFPLSKDDISKVALSEATNGQGAFLTFNLIGGNNIEFQIKQKDLWEVKDFLKNIKLNYETEKIKKPIAHTDNKPVSTQKHGVPALLSFFVPGLGQIIKGDFVKGFLIWLIGGTMIFIFSVSIILIPFAFIVWAWNIYDAYNSNKN